MLPFKLPASTVKFSKKRKKISCQSHLKPYTLTQPFHGDMRGVFRLSQSDSCIWRLYSGLGMARKLSIARKWDEKHDQNWLSVCHLHTSDTL